MEEQKIKMTKKKIKLSYYGPIKTQDGIGLASKLHLEALKKSKKNKKLNFSIKEFKLSRNVGFQKNIDLIDKISFETLNKENSLINYFHFSPRWIQKYLSNKEKDFLKSKINIGYWVCESQKIPDEWIENIDFYDEIWTSSKFCKNVYEKYLNIPVEVINHPVPENEISECLISRYNKNNYKPFTFLTIANAFSDLRRKNSIAVIKAFKKAFKPNDCEVKLIVKLTNSKDDIEEFKKIISLIQDYENIELINEHLSPKGIEKLYKQADTYVSLHRSEGFGLTISDAYSFGIPVIATGYSGNLDILSNKENELLVDYDLTFVGEERLRYHSDDIWAEPDIENAKEKMIKVRENFNHSFEEALKVRKVLRKDFNLQRIGEKMNERITRFIC